MASRYGKWIRRWEIEEIVSVPLHPSRKRTRGFNQAELLAKALGELSGIPVEPKAVRRIRKTKYQKQLDDAGRRQNLKGAFSVVPGWNQSGVFSLWMILYDRQYDPQNSGSTEKSRGAKSVFFDYKHWTRALSICYTKQDGLLWKRISGG